MAIRRRSEARTIGGFSEAMIEILLTGQSESDPFLEFEISAQTIDEAWREFGPQLLAERERRGLSGKTAP